MSLFPIYLSSGESSSNETIKSISKSLNANVRELMKEEYHGESSSLHTYSLIKSLLSSKQLTRKDLLKISNLDINAIKEQPSLFLLETKNAK
jgi:hypothetical protein